MRTVHALVNELCIKGNAERAALYFRTRGGGHAQVWFNRGDSRLQVEAQVTKLIAEGARPFGYIWFENHICLSEPLPEHPEMRHFLVEECRQHQPRAAS